MLSHKEIEKRVRETEVKISYAFLPDSNGCIQFYPDECLVDLDQPDSEATRFFVAQLFSDRLRITLGPIVRTHDPYLSSKRPAFGSRPNCFDIRSTGDVLTLEPFETVSVASNERVTFGSKTGGLILPRLSNADAGIVLTVAYIDPYWDGILQMVLTNITPQRQQLRLLDTICQCVFFSIDGDVDQVFRDRFPRKSHHYGQNWRKILVEDGDPFPLRKVPLPRRSLLSRSRFALHQFWREYSHLINGLGLLGILLAVAVGYGALSAQIGDMENLRSDLEKEQEKVQEFENKQFPSLQRSVDKLENRLPVVGVQRMVIKAGEAQATSAIELDRPVSRTASVWTQVERRVSGIAVDSRLSTGGAPNISDLRITVSIQTKAQVDTEVEVRWMVVF